MPVRRSCVIVLALAAMMIAAPPMARAQSLYLPRDGKHSVLFEMLKPSIEQLDQDFLSGAYFLSGRVRVTERAAFVGELVYANQASTYVGMSYWAPPTISSSTFGNFYLGLESSVGSGPVFLELGFRAPIASKEQFYALDTGSASDVTRWDAFIPNIVAIQAAFDASETAPSGMTYHLRLSPVVDLPTGENPSDTQAYAVYSFLIGYHGRAVRVSGAESGRALLTGGYGNLGSRVANQLELHADFLSGSVRPGLAFTLPLGELGTYFPLVLGFNIAWSR